MLNTKTTELLTFTDSTNMFNLFSFLRTKDGKLDGNGRYGRMIEKLWKPFFKKFM